MSFTSLGLAPLPYLNVCIDKITEFKTFTKFCIKSEVIKILQYLGEGVPARYDTCDNSLVNLLLTGVYRQTTCESERMRTQVKLI